MRRFLAIIFVVTIASSAAAQNTMVVNTERIFNSVQEYKDAVAKVDSIGNVYQESIDLNFDKVEKSYQEYMSNRAYMSDSNRENREQKIIDAEQKILKYQESIFGPNGTLMQKRIELIKPVQDAVFKVINDYATNNGFGVVLDSSNNSTLIFYSDGVDKTEDIINLLKR